MSDMGCPKHADCLRMFRETPPTVKELRSVGLLMKLRPEFDEAEALQFVRVFSWEIRQSPGGVQGLLAKWEKDRVSK